MVARACALPNGPRASQLRTSSFRFAPTARTASPARSRILELPHSLHLQVAHRLLRADFTLLTCVGARSTQWPNASTQPVPHSCSHARGTSVKSARRAFEMTLEGGGRAGAPKCESAQVRHCALLARI